MAKPAVLLLLLLWMQQASAFSDKFYFDVKENSPPQTFVGKIKTRPGFVYHFNDEPIEFDLDPQTGVLLTTDVSIDREIKSVYNLVILSSSPTYPIEVIIRILDVNDNVPFWPAYINTNLSFSESAPIGTKVIIDNAIDLDSGDLHYRIDYVSDLPTNSASTSSYFASNTVLPFKLNYNTSTSFLYFEVAYKLDREVQSNYLVNLTAFDEDHQSSSALFNIRIVDSNDNPPIFDHSDYSVSLNESMPKDVSLLQVRATDADEENNDNSRVSYYLNSEDFKIDPTSGVISTAHDGPIICGTSNEKHDSDYYRVCVFTVFAHDYGVPRQDGRTYVTAKIYDSNNNAPTIKFRYFSKSDFANVDENALNGSVVAAVSVIDFDQGLNGQTWLEVTDGNQLEHFRLESIGNSHIIRVNATLDRENVPSYNLTLVAHDYGTPSKSSTATLIIEVQDHNDHAPKFDKDVYEATIPENENQIGAFVYAVHATDEDEGINSQIYYSISGSNSHYFKIDSVTGLITTDKFINREEIDYFELRVTARDGGSNPKWAHSLLKVKISDINDEVPSIELLPKYRFNNESNQYEVELEEGSLLDLNLIVKDSDLGNNGSVDVQILFDYDGMFKVDHESMKLVSTQKMNFEQCHSYRVMLMATDQAEAEHRLSSLTTIQISVKDIDDELPQLLPSRHFAFISVNAPRSFNNSFHRLKVKDIDFPTPVSFQIQTKDDIIKQLFYLSESGEIQLKSNVNGRVVKNVPSMVTFDIDCLGCQPGFNSTQMNIFLINTDHNSLDRDQRMKREYHFSIEENQPVGSVVGELEVDDEYRLYIVDGNENEHFALSAKRIVTGRLLDREVMSNYRLQVVAMKDNYFQHIEITIHLIDVNDCEPYFFKPYDQIVLDDNAPPMVTVYRFEAIDEDLQSNSTKYRLVENPFELFMVEGNELKLSKTIKEAINSGKRSLSPINTTGLRMLRVLIRAIDGQQLLMSHNHQHRPSNRSSEMTLLLKVNFTHRPNVRFVKKFHEMFITESIAINEQVYRLETSTEHDNSVGYSIVAGNSQNSFGIFPNGYLYVKNRLDRETSDVYLLEIVAHRSGSNDSTLDNCQVLIHVKDINDNRPIFEQKAYRFSVPENVSSDFFIGQVSAHDADVGPNSQLVYSVIKSYYSSFVEIDPSRGYLWTNREYDRENLSYFEIVIQARDQPIDEDRFTAQVAVRIDILDINDNKPIFEVANNITLTSKSDNDLVSGELVVSEAFAVHSTLVHFKVRDADYESSIAFKLHDTDKVGISTLDPATGVLSLAKPLDRETQDSYRFTIEAFDGKFQSFFNLKLIVADVDDCAPQWVNFTQTEFFIPENISIGSEIITFNAIDYDLGSNALFHFAIANFSGNQKVFDILNHKLVVINHLDYEKAKVHHLNISLIETISRHVASMKSIRINLIDVNDCKPVFIQRSETEVVRVLENIDIGTKLLTLQAADCDQNDVLTYEIVSCNTHYHTHKNIYQKDHELQHKHDSNNCPLKLNTKTGEIVNINNLDREVIESINLKVSVRDSVGHMDRMKVIFIIDDINDEAPMFVSPTKIILTKEMTKPNMVIGGVKAIDLDLGINSAIVYRLESGQYEDYLHIDRFSGMFKTKRSLEPLLAGELYINVSAVDGGGLTTMDTIHFIMRPNLPYLEPVRIQVDIYENEPIGTQVTKLNCNSRHTLAACHFHLINATDRNFQVDSFTGIIMTVDLIDREMLEKRLLEVLVISQFNLQLIQVHINILDQNDNPPYLTNTSIVVHLRESLMTPAEVFDLAQLIADEDTNNKFDFQIINCSNCEGVFSLNRKSGILTLLSPLDCEKTDKYRLLFGVSDGIYLLTSLMEIIVDDENDNKPYFNQSVYIFPIDENTERGTTVGQVDAFDDDVSSKNLIYSVVRHNQDDGVEAFASAFSLDSRSGQFTLSKRLDYETDPDQYVAYVAASDGKFKSQPVKVIFKLINLNDNPPIFETRMFKLEISENRVLSNILCVTATDADVDNGNTRNGVDGSRIHNLTYRIDFGYLKTQSFDVNQSNGCISIVRPLDREEFSLIDLTMIADDGYFNATALINVRVLDENDNYPQFDKKTPKVIRLEENTAVDTVVYTFSAVDADEPPNSYIKYEIIDNGNLSSQLPFVIGPIDGQLKVTGLIDRESVDSYSIVIRANDYGLKYTDFACRIEVEDVIDNSPVFEKSYYEISVFENLTVGESLFKLHAFDADETDEINYKIISGDIQGHFAIENDFIVLAMSLDYEQINVYNLKINAIDKASNLDTMNIKVSVLNVLDEKPVFDESPFYYNWFENQIGVVGKFEVLSENKILSKRQALMPYGNAVNYLLLNNYGDSFRMNSTNAILSVISPIDREMLIETNPDSTIELKIIAIDSRSRLSSEAMVYIHIVDANDNRPFFTSDSYTFYLNENQFYDVNTTIGQVEAVDADQSDVLRYKLQSLYEDKFSIDQTGRVQLVSSIIFDREEQSSYEMKVQVSDGKHSISTTIRVFIADINDCTPQVTKINNIMLNKHNLNSLNEFKLKIPFNKLNSILDKKFPLIGLQVSDCDSGLNGQIQMRLNNAELYSWLKIDERNAVIKSDYKNINLQLDSLHKISNVDLTVNDLSELNQLSSAYSIKLEFTDVESYRETSLVSEDFVELRLSELTAINETLYRFELSQTISEINIYAGDVYNRFTVVDNRLILLRPLDFEHTKSYDLYLQAINHQKDFEDFQYIFVRINVLNENDNPPAFLHDVYNASIGEEEDRIFVAQVTAIDVDSADTRIKYKLTNADHLPFEIDAGTGSIWTTAKIDREVNASFTLIASAEDEDGLTSVCRIKVQIEDKNDNPPRFTRLFRANITENTPIGTFVIQVTSIDKDLDNNSNVTYNLLTETDAFVIDPYSGKVFVNTNLDREDKEQYLLIVSANDGSWKSQTTLTIYILDENDIAPKFGEDLYEFDVLMPENSSAGFNLTTGRVTAIDGDKNLNGLINYKLKNKSKYFAIDSQTGEIRIIRPPKLYPPSDTYFLNQHFLTIVASDRGLLPRSSEVNVIIRCHSTDEQFDQQFNLISIKIPANLQNQTLLYTSNSMISLVDSEVKVVQTHYNQLLFNGEALVRLDEAFIFMVDIDFSKIVFNLTVIETNKYSPTFSNNRNATSVPESIGSVLIQEFNAKDRDNSNYNNLVTYSFNVSKIHWHSNAENYLMWTYKEKYPNLFKLNLSSEEIVANIVELSYILNPFQLDQNNGKLLLINYPDYELITRYDLSIIAKDNGWYPLQTIFDFAVNIEDIEDFVDYNLVDSNLLHHSSAKPDPMSIGVILVIFFFVVLILVISTSFLLYHNQRKNQVPQRKIATSSLGTYLSSNSQFANHAVANSARFGSQMQSQLSRPQEFNTNQSIIHPQGSQFQQPQPQPVSHQSISSNAIRMNSVQQYRADMSSLSNTVHRPSSSNQSMLIPKPDIVSPSPITSVSHSVANALNASRMHISTAASSIYTHTNSENYTDNYSNILASAEHYDLENASSIAPSDIDIVYHYKGYRNRDNLLQNQKHAPLSRLSPSVSELSSAPRILTLQDLSPQVPPCPPILNPRGQVSRPDDDTAPTENSFNCSESYDYDLKAKGNMFTGRVW